MAAVPRSALIGVLLGRTVTASRPDVSWTKVFDTSRVGVRVALVQRTARVKIARASHGGLLRSTTCLTPLDRLVTLLQLLDEL